MHHWCEAELFHRKGCLFPLEVSHCHPSLEARLNATLKEGKSRVRMPRVLGQFLKVRLGFYLIFFKLLSWLLFALFFVRQLASPCAA